MYSQFTKRIIFFYFISICINVFLPSIHMLLIRFSVINFFFVTYWQQSINWCIVYYWYYQQSFIYDVPSFGSGAYTKRLYTIFMWFCCFVHFVLFLTVKGDWAQCLCKVGLTLLLSGELVFYFYGIFILGTLCNNFTTHFSNNCKNSYNFY